MKRRLSSALIGIAEHALPPCMLLAVVETTAAHPDCSPRWRDMSTDMVEPLRLAIAEAFETCERNPKKACRLICQVAASVIDAGDPRVLLLGTSQWMLSMMDATGRVMGAGSFMDIATTRLFDELQAEEWAEDERAAADMLASLTAQRFASMGLYRSEARAAA